MNMKNFSGFMVLMLTLLFIMGTSVHAKTTFLHIDSIEKMKPNGIFTIEVYQKGKWQSAGGLFFDKTFRERNMDLSRFLKDDEKARIRIIQKGGGRGAYRFGAPGRAGAMSSLPSIQAPLLWSGLLRWT
ncbi:MAG: hypothetical protein JRI34_07990 [Deltaproteobacteria bacterium]|nr:hypothetical protein [Deltaproteobacteria bacterium]